MFGLNTEESDMDYVEIHKEDNSKLLGLDYDKEIQYSKDYRSYELGKFVELLLKNNPSTLEYLYASDRCIIETSPEFELLRENKHLFLSKLCKDTFGQYASTQIEKASGYNKKANWEKNRIDRKTVLDFCYFIDKDDTKPVLINDWLNKEGYKQEYCGLSKINHFNECYFLFIDERQWIKEGNHRFENIETFNYQGIVKDLQNSNDVCLSSIPTYALHKGILTFLKNSYSTHCKDYQEYQSWIKNRNENRYNTNLKHGQNFDGKNLSHCRRLLDTTKYISINSDIKVDVSDKKDYYLSIKNGLVNLEEIIKQSKKDIQELADLYQKSILQDKPDFNKVNKLLIKLRQLK